MGNGALEVPAFVEGGKWAELCSAEVKFLLAPFAIFGKLLFYKALFCFDSFRDLFMTDYESELSYIGWFEKGLFFIKCVIE